MMHPTEIQRISDEAAHKAARQKKKPYSIFDEAELDRWVVGENVPFKFPHLGSYVPKGWKKVGEFFVDSTGFGIECELALTQRAFKEKLREQIREGNKYSYGIGEVGPFQTYICYYEKEEAP